VSCATEALFERFSFFNFSLAHNIITVEKEILIYEAQL